LAPPAKAPASIREKLERLFLRIIPTEPQRLLLLTILSGGLCGLAAVCFHVGIGKAEDLVINRALAVPFPTWIYLAILTPAVGGLLVGLGLHYWVPGAVGSGVPQVKVAYALQGGDVPFRDAVGKFVLGIVQKNQASHVTYLVLLKYLRDRIV